MKPEFYKDDSENDWALPIPVLPYPGIQWRHMFQIALPEPLKAGDLIEVFGNGEVRLDAPYNTEFVTKLTITPGLPYYAEDLWGYNGQPGVGYFLQKIHGFNVDPQDHYFAPTFAGAMVVPADMPQSVITAGVRCRSDMANSQNGSATILSGYGSLWAKVWRANAS
jgi:hypothetical protein